MTESSTEFYRLDPLTGCHNFLSFVETLDQLSARVGEQSFSILYLDMNYLKVLNDTKGHAYGDSAIRWLGLVLQEESGVNTYRVGGDDFAAILTNGIHADHEELLNRIHARLNKEGEQLGIPLPAARIALIHYDSGSQVSFNDIMFQLGETMLDVKVNKRREIKIYEARELIRSTARVDEQNRDTLERSWKLLQSIANDAIHRLVMMGRVLDVTQKTSFIDSISGLPNMRAALLKMEKSLASKQPFSIMLIDGDNLRLYNTINYAAGDEVIQKWGLYLQKI